MKRMNIQKAHIEILRNRAKTIGADKEVLWDYHSESMGHHHLTRKEKLIKLMGEIGSWSWACSKDQNIKEEQLLRPNFNEK